MRRQVTAKIVERRSIGPELRGQMFGLMAHCYDGLDPARFAADLDDKQRVILLRERATRELVGFSTVRVDDEQIDGRKALVVFSGDTVILPEFWGVKELQLCFVRHIAWLALTHPRHRVFWLLVSKGYKTYLMIANYVPDSVPRYDAAGAGPLSRFLDGLAARRWPGAWVPELGVLRWGSRHDRVKAHVASIGDELLDNPHVAYFVARNPGYVDGDELVCLAEAKVRTLITAAVHMLRGRRARDVARAPATLSARA